MIVEFKASGRGKARCEANPDYPDGVHLDMAQEKSGCDVELPYPAPECGYFLVKCETCGSNAAITAAGRPDDPRTAKLPCRPMN